MRIALIALAFLLTGCAHSPFMEPLHAADVIVPCDKDNCGKTVKWDFYDPVPAIAKAEIPQ